MPEWGLPEWGLPEWDQFSRMHIRGAEMLTPLALAGEEAKGFYRWETDLR